MNNSEDPVNPQSELSSCHPDKSSSLQPDSTIAQELHSSQNNEELPESSPQTPIQIHIPEHLKSFAIPLSQFHAQPPQSQYHLLVVGACIFSTRPRALSYISARGPSTDLATSAGAPVNNTEEESPRPHILLVQRANKDSMPSKWEIPGGGIDNTDPTILHGLAREVFEETGLRLTRVVDLIETQEFFGRRGKYCKWSFEIEVAEIHPPRQLDETSTECVEDLASVPVVLDPEEHQDFAWVRMENMNEYSITTKDQKHVIERSFGIHNGTERGARP